MMTPAQRLDLDLVFNVSLWPVGSACDHGVRTAEKCNELAPPHACLPRAQEGIVPIQTTILKGPHVAIDVRFGSLADIATSPRYVSFTPNSGHEMAIRDLWNLVSALAPKLSALPPKADIGGHERDVRFGPKADIETMSATR
jgi:hypothetical protein